MLLTNTAIPDVKIVKPVRHLDSRGFFSEVYREDLLRQHGIDIRFVQDNHSLSVSRGVVRGLHFQIPPFTQAKLLRVTAGAVFDVAVDIRRGSPSYGHHVAVLLKAHEWNQIFIPEGFAHGYCTLDPNSEVIYKVSNYYSAEHDRGLLWDDPGLAIAWPDSVDPALISEKDRKHPHLADLPPYFLYDTSPSGGGIERLRAERLE
jgi:dTDP-4-dehydrorhamnose 3,5-epimerase